MGEEECLLCARKPAFLAGSLTSEQARFHSSCRSEQACTAGVRGARSLEDKLFPSFADAIHACLDYWKPVGAGHECPSSYDTDQVETVVCS